MDLGTGIVVGGLFIASATAAALLLNGRKDESAAAEAEARALRAETALANQRIVNAQPQQYATAGNTGGALNGVANVIQSLGGASGISSLLSLGLNH